VLTRLSVAESEREQAAVTLASLRKAMSELEAPSSIAGRTEEIEEIHQELGSQRKAARDRISIETRRNTLRTEARQILRSLREDLTIDQAERLWIKRSEAVRIHELGTEYERIETRIEEARRKIPELVRQIAAVEDRLRTLPHPRPVEALRSALAAAEEVLPIEKQLAAARTECRALIRACEQGTARLGLARTPLEQLERLAVPATETLRVFEERLDGIARRMSSFFEEVRRNEDALSEIDRRLEEVRLEREVPTEEDLRAAREIRDRGWRLIARNLEGAAVPEEEAGRIIQAFPGQATLAGAFEVSVARADETADRLRREADRVAEKARLLAERTVRRAGLEKGAEQLAAAQDEHGAVLAEWAGVWQPLGVPARSPREMRQWAADFRMLAEKASETLKRTAQCDALGAEIETGFAALSHCIETFSEPPATPGETLSALNRRVRRIAEVEEELARRRDELGREGQRLSSELETLTLHLKANEGERARWQQAWAQAVKPLGLEAAARPAEAQAVMEELASLFEKLQRAEVEQKRMDGIDRDAEAFRLKVATLAAAVAEDLGGRPAEEAALELQRRLTRAKEAHAKRLALQKQVEQAQAKLRKSTDSIAEIESLLRGMCAEAGCNKPADLPEAERRSDLRRRLEGQLREIDERLLQLGGGSEVADFIGEVSVVDPDGIGGDIERLKEEIGRLTAMKSELDQRIGGERTELGRMDGGDRAALIAAQIQSILGALERDVAHYARLKIAGRVLTLAMERFREKSQGPILRMASELFKRITCGSFEGLRADRDPDGHPVLVGVRKAGKETVAVEGMSDGTADQLYLSLRLAGLGHYLDSNEALPFIVDDILIKFDNARAVAALQALAELSRRTQVIFFTHHQHLLELAATHLPGSILIEHHLE
jgi:chromosome segregation ATPase